MISIIHPSRGRPREAAMAAMMWRSLSGVKVEYILSLDDDDPLLKSYAPGFTGWNCHVVSHFNKCAVDAINNGAKYTSGNILIVISDDFECSINWGLKLEDSMLGMEDWILKVPDGIQDWVITLPIMDRKYYNRFGYIYHPEYFHAFCDTEMTCVSELLNRKAVGFTDPDFKFKHKHYSIEGGMPKDATYNRSDAHFEQGRRKFMERIQRNFDLPINQIIGKMKDNFYTRMHTGYITRETK